jgi:hypothetical protein
MSKNWMVFSYFVAASVAQPIVGMLIGASPETMMAALAVTSVAFIIYAVMTAAELIVDAIYDSVEEGEEEEASAPSF